MGQATLEGQGIALTDVNPLSADPAADRLVRLFECSMETQEGDYITYPPGALRRPKVKAPKSQGSAGRPHRGIARRETGANSMTVTQVGTTVTRGSVC